MPLELDSPEIAKDLWFTLPPSEAGPAMVANAKAIESGQSARRAENLKYAMAYAQRELNSLYDLAAPAVERTIAPWALISAVVSTGASMVTRNHVKLTVETAGADAKLRRDAKEATRWVNGVFRANKVSTELAPSLFVDAAVCNLGLAVVRVEIRDGIKRLAIDRVLPDEIIVADAEAIYGNPHQGFLKRWLPLHVALKLYGTDPGKKLAIERSPDECPAFKGSYRPAMRALYEGWAVDTKGAHIVAVDGCTLQCEPWTYNFLPWAPMYIERPQAGYWGRGWAQQLYGYQVQIWDINDSIQECIRLCASPKWFNPIGSGVPNAALSNEHGGIIASNPNHEPKLVVFPALPKELVAERQTNWDQGLADVGLSDWGVTGEQPGKMSGVALDQLRDREFGRIVTTGGEYEGSHVRLGEICLHMGPEVTDWKVEGRTPGDRDLKSVDFKRISRLIRDAPWSVNPPAPIAAFPSSPAGKRKAVLEWVEKAIMTPHEGAMALDLQDNDAEASLLFSLREEVLEQIDDILEHGEKGYKAPEAIMVQVGGPMPAQLAAKAYFLARRQEVDETKLDLLLKWIASADALLTQLKAPPPLQLGPVEVVAGGATFAPAPQAIAAPGPVPGGPPPALPLPDPGLPPGAPPLPGVPV